MQVRLGIVWLGSGKARLEMHGLRVRVRQRQAGDAYTFKLTLPSKYKGVLFRTINITGTVYLANECRVRLAPIMFPHATFHHSVGGH